MLVEGLVGFVVGVGCEVPAEPVWEAGDKVRCRFAGEAFGEGEAACT